MTTIPGTGAPSYRLYAQQAASGQLASSASAALAASAVHRPTEINRHDLHATLGKKLDAVA